MTVQELIDRAEKARYALIIDEADEQFADTHLREIYQAYPCTGILVRRRAGGSAYHMTPVDNVPGILRFGLLPCTDENATYGDGAIYAFPKLSCYQKIDPGKWALFQMAYAPGCLQALATFDRSENEQHELLIFPDKLVFCKQIPIPPELQKETEGTI